MASNKEARKGIRTKAGADMADKRFQLDENDADLTELIEYARLSAMMLFSEHHGVVPDADLTKQRPLH